MSAFLETSFWRGDGGGVNGPVPDYSGDRIFRAVRSRSLPDGPGSGTGQLARRDTTGSPRS